MAKANLEFNIQFRGSAQLFQGQDTVNVREVIQGTTDAFARILVDDVALSASDRLYKNARASFIRELRHLVEQDIAQLGTTIARAYGLQAKRTGPYGPMTIPEHELSFTMRNMPTFANNYDRSFTNIKWAPRTKKYMKWKARNKKPSNWWRLEGKLIQKLSQPDIYLDDFGPLRVLFFREQNQANARSRIQPKSGRFVRDPTAFGRDRRVGQGVNVTQRGMMGFDPKTNVEYGRGPGRTGSTYQVGRVEVLAMNRITPAMIPGLATMDPKKATPTNGTGLAGLIKDDEVQAKMLRTPKGQQPRWALEPFVSFYLTRKIPNTVFKRVEKLIQGSAGRSQYGGKKRIHGLT